MHNRKFNLRSTLNISTISMILLVSSCAHHPAAPSQPLQPSQTVKTSEALAWEAVQSGLEVFLENDHQFDSLKYGLLANQTSVNRDLVHGVQLLQHEVNLRLILSPEHGLFGAEDAGANIAAGTEISTGIKSLTTYGKKPQEIAEMIADLDVILFDIQDIGVRSYTYISSMAYLMKAAAVAGKKIVILDRPNPVNGRQTEGNILNPQFKSFVGIYPIPYRHGMTTGELALLFNTEFDINCELEIIKMDGWHRDMWFDETGLPWVPTSPHVPDAATILPMITTGTYGELGTLSEGVGTTIPFELTGGPWISNPHEFAAALQERLVEGVTFRPTFFKPYYGRHKGQLCGGVQIHVTDRDRFSPYLTGLLLMSVHQELYPEIDLFQNEGRWSMFAKVMGTDKIQKDIVAGMDPVDMEKEWQDELEQFRELRKKYLLYE